VLHPGLPELNASVEKHSSDAGKLSKKRLENHSKAIGEWVQTTDGTSIDWKLVGRRPYCAAYEQRITLGLDCRQ